MTTIEELTPVEQPKEQERKKKKKDIYWTINDESSYYNQNWEEKGYETTMMAIIGDKGMGKTLLMSIFSLFSEGNIMSNFWLNKRAHPNRLLYKFDFIRLLTDKTIRMLMYDELHLIADQYSNSSKEVRILRALLSQSRKNNQVVLYSSQDETYVAKDLRFDTTHIAKPKYIKNKDLLKIEVWGKDSDKIKKLKVHQASRFYELYNTRQYLIDHSVINELKELAIKNSEVHNKFIENVPQEIREQFKL